MNAAQYFGTYQNQSLLYNTKVPALRGQCVQAVCFYVAANSKPVIWADAAEWWYSGQYADQYERIANTPVNVPRPDDIMVWDRNLPNSGGAGHLAVCLQPLPGTGTFISVDSNWGGKTVHKVTHNYNYVVGWLRFRSAPAPVSPPPAVLGATSGGVEMIANTDQAIKIYKMLRPNGSPSQGELDNTAGRRTFANFMNDAQGEVAARDNALLGQSQKLDNMSQTINNQNQTITDLTAKLSSAETSAQEKQAALTEALAKIASDNSDLASAHDQIVDLGLEVTGYQNNPVVKAQEAAKAASKNPTSSGKLFASILAAFGKFKLGKK